MNPELKKVYDTYRDLARTLPGDLSKQNYMYTFHSDITREVLKLNLPADPSCPNAGKKGHKATATGPEGDYCGLCGCRARWFFFGEKWE